MREAAAVVDSPEISEQRPPSSCTACKEYRSPWITIRSNDKKRARLNAMRFILSKFEYTNKDHDLVGEPDPLIVMRGRDQIGD